MYAKYIAMRHTRAAIGIFAIELYQNANYL